MFGSPKEKFFSTLRRSRQFSRCTSCSGQFVYVLFNRGKVGQKSPTDLQEGVGKI